MTSLSAFSSLTSLAKLKAPKATGPSDIKSGTTTPAPVPAQTGTPEAPKPATAGPASAIGARTPAERVSLGTILTLQTSPPQPSSQEAPKAATQADGTGADSPQGSQADGAAGPSLDLLKGQTKAPTAGNLGALQQNDLVGESANLQNIRNRQAVGVPGYGLTAQNPQSLLHLFA